MADKKRPIPRGPKRPSDILNEAREKPIARRPQRPRQHADEAAEQMQDVGEQRLSLDVPKDFHHEFKWLCGVRNTTMKEVINEMIRGYVQEHRDELPEKLRWENQ